MRISYVMPCHDGAATLTAAAESVLRELADGDELVVVDDGSTDDTPTLLAGLAARHGARLRALTQRNAGPAAARNRGMAAATGDWIGFLDCDDELLPGAVERWRAATAAAPEAGFLLAGRLERLPGGRERRLEGQPVAPEPRRAMADFLVEDRRSIGVGAILVRREVALAAGFPEELRYAEDNVFFARCFAMTTAHAIAAPAYRYNYEPEREEGRVLFGSFDVARMVDLAFDPARVPPSLQELKPRALAAARLSAFRDLHRRGRDREARVFWRQAFAVAPGLALRLRYLRKVARGLLGLRHPAGRRASRA